MTDWLLSRRKLLGAALATCVVGPVRAGTKFEAFIETLWPRAKAEGISRALFDKAFAGISEPDPAVLKLAQTQPEVTSTTSAYLAKAVTPIRIESGKTLKAEQARLLEAIEGKYGVDRHILLSIWGMESNFGKDLGSMLVMRSLATLIYAGRKRDYARQQYVAALKILQKGIIAPERFVGSWAGAMGHTQFIPTSYLSYAVDWTGDGKKDIWDSKEDALASTANYLRKAGWSSDRPWGWEVTLPSKFDRSMIGRSKWRTVADWSKLGVGAATGGSLKPGGAEAFVMVPQGLSGPKFLVTRNFMAIMAYNQSHSYALAVGHLADRIRGGGPFVNAWPDVDYDLTAAQRIEIQRLLVRHGFNPGGTDGRFGARTYEAIIGFQRTAGMTIDGQPSQALLERLRKGI
jgi:membrane-bound lytic murein transglycosylase B